MTNTVIINDSNHIYVDSRQDEYFNGYKHPGFQVIGHIDGAIQFPVEWIDKIHPQNIKKFVEEKGFRKDNKITIYDFDNSRAEKLKLFFEDNEIGKEINVMDDIDTFFLNNSEVFKKFPNYQLFISPDIIHFMLAGNKDNDKEIIILEAVHEEYDKPHLDYYKNEGVFIDGSIPGAILFDISEIENPETFHLKDVASLYQVFADYGIKKDTTIIVYAKNLNSMYRLAYALYYCDFDDVRLLNGGLGRWVDSGYELSQSASQPQSIDREYNVTSKKDKYIQSSDEAFLKMNSEKLKLISIRSWEEHTSQKSGYDDLPTLGENLRVGEPEGVIWGFCSRDSRRLEDYLDPDSTFRNPKEIEKLWLDQGFSKEDYVAFYCGSGWRACLPFFYSLILGWESTALYDGGWKDWQNNLELPIQNFSGEIKPSSKNSYRISELDD